MILLALVGLALLAAPAAAVTQPPILTAPVSSTTYRSPIPTIYSLPDVPAAGSVHLVFSGTNGSITFSLPDGQSGNYQWDPSTDPASSIGVPADATSLADGVYTVTLAYQNATHDPVATAFATDVTIDTVTQTPVLTAPVASSMITTTIPVSYTLPETPLANSVELKFDGANGHLTLTLDGATSGSFSWDPQTDPALLAHVVGVTGGTSLPDGTYDVTLRYRDAIGNAVSFVQATGVIVATQPTTTTATTTTTIATTTTTSATATTTSTTSSTTTTAPSTSSTTSTTATVTTTTTTSTTLAPACTGGVAIDAAMLRITHVDGVAANEKLLLEGTLGFAAGAPTAAVPVATGAQFVVRPVANPSAPALLALAAEDGDPIPAGSPGTGCGPKDGWIGLRYANRSGFVDPPACTRSAHGLRVFRLRDRRARGKGIVVTVKTARTTVTDQPPAGAIEVTVALGGTASDLLAGACGVVVFQPADCVLDGRTFRCRFEASRRRK